MLQLQMRQYEQMQSFNVQKWSESKLNQHICTVDTLYKVLTVRYAVAIQYRYIYNYFNYSMVVTRNYQMYNPRAKSAMRMKYFRDILNLCDWVGVSRSSPLAHLTQFYSEATQGYLVGSWNVTYCAVTGQTNQITVCNY